jgi:hypothetical protein
VNGRGGHNLTGNPGTQHRNLDPIARALINV